MTAWDFLTEAFKWLTDAPGFADGFFRVVVLVLLVMFIIEVIPGKWKPLSKTARALGKAFNADVTDRVSKLEKNDTKQEKDNVRTQLLVLIADYKENTQEIMEVAHHYFAEIKGDWYMTTIFNQWLTENKVGKPEWFNPKE